MYRLLAAGRSQAAIATELGLSRNTVRRFARADPGELLIRDWAPRTASVLHDYEPYLQERWNADCTNATALWQEIRARGYRAATPSSATTPRDSEETLSRPPEPPDHRNPGRSPAGS